MMIFISGWGATDEIWSPVTTELGMPCRCLPWQDCLGDSALDNALLRTLQDSSEPCVLVGWSLGALIASSATLANPERVAALVLIGATARMTAADEYPGADARSLRTMLMRLKRNPVRVLEDFCQQCLSPAGPARKDFCQQCLSPSRQCLSPSRQCLSPSRQCLSPARQCLSPARPAGEDFCQQCLSPAGGDERFTSQFLHQAETLTPEELMAGLEYLACTDLRAQLPRIAVPTTLVHGSADQIIPLASTQYLAAHLQQAELVTIPDGGHALPYTHAAPIAASIRRRLHAD
jgi:pimeloyl-ACP methyl ester carboxylesterase